MKVSHVSQGQNMIYPWVKVWEKVRTEKHKDHAKPTEEAQHTPFHFQSEKNWDPGADSTHLWHR